jgi:hypothetical protein
MEQTLIQGVTNYWCRTKGIHNKDLDTHPHIDDVIFLLKWRDAMWDMCNLNERAFWGSVWGNVYNKKTAIKKHILAKFETVTIQAITRHNNNLDIKAKQKERIKQLRQQKARV